MSYPQPDNFMASSILDGGQRMEFWWVGFAGKRGAKVVKVDEFGMRWTLDIESTHWVTQKVAAGLLKVSLMTVNKWVRDGSFRNHATRRGVSVISLKEVEEVARQRGVYVREAK
jgi:hypothetical protein